MGKIGKSKKGTKNWRKNTDIKEVENHIAEKVKEDLRGGAPATRPNELLFFQDIKGGLTEEEKRRKKTLKIHQILTPNEFLKPASGKIQKVQKNGTADLRKIAKLTNTLSRTQEIKPNNPKVPEKSLDIWGENPKEEEEHPAFQGGFTNPHKKVIPKPPGQRSIPSKLPSVQIPPAGISYKPDEKNHQELLEQAVAEEIQKREAQAKVSKAVGSLLKTAKRGFVSNIMMEGSFPELGINRPRHMGELEAAEVELGDEEEAENKKLPALIFGVQNREEENDNEEILDSEENQLILSPEEIDQAMEVEGKQLIRIKPAKSEDDDEEEEENSEAVKRAPVRAEDRKTKRERNKEKKKKLTKIAAAKERAKTRKDRIFNRLPSIVKQIERKAQERREIKKAKIEKKKELTMQPKRLGSMKYQKLPLELKLPNELPDNLRKLKMEGNLFRDRFMNYQERNILEPRLPAPKRRRYALKVTDVKARVQ